MLIEEEADAVFNEIRKMRKEFPINDDVASAFNEAKKESKASSKTPIITINVNVLNTPENHHEDKTDNHSSSSAPQKEPEDDRKKSAVEDMELEVEDVELEEPVSPPSCHPDEGPPLLFSHRIEDLAAVIVNEKRQEEQEEQEEEEEVVEEKPPVRGVPALIPLTVSEFGERPSPAPPSILHMSGGGVYTTDSYYDQSTPTVSNSDQIKKKAGQTSVIKKLPSQPTSTTTFSKSKTVIQNNTARTFNKQTNENVLWQLYKNSGLITEAKKTIKLSDGLEITPILTAQPTKKRSYESTEIDNNEASKRARSDLVIEKIPRKNTKEEQSEQRDLTTNEQVLDCKLVISRIYKKAKLVFENGTEVPLSKNIFRHIIPVTRQAPAQSKRIRRKTIRTRKHSNNKVESNLEEHTKIIEDEKITGNPESVVVEMPLNVDKDSAKSGIPQSYDCDNASKLPGVGQHKLPSIVTQPSYHKGANRKIAVKSK